MSCMTSMFNKAVSSIKQKSSSKGKHKLKRGDYCLPLSSHGHLTPDGDIGEGCEDPEPNFRTQFKASYVDFIPRCAGSGNIICAPEYERFEQFLLLTRWLLLITGRANEWLQENPGLVVRQCESVGVKGRYDGLVDTNRSCYYEADHSRRWMRNLYIRALRLWVVRREKCHGDAPQQLGYVNLVPHRASNGVFESFGDTISKFNEHLRNHPLPGRILNVETLEMKYHEWGSGIDADETSWVESVKFNTTFLITARVYFEQGPPACEEIGCADFVPANLDEGSQFAAPQYESFSVVFNKAASWIQHQRQVRVTNVQSIDYKMKHDCPGEPDTQRSFFVESGRFTTKYLRIVRVSFVRPFDGRPLDLQPQLVLNCVTFEPTMLNNGGIICIPVFERLSETMKRAMVWLNKTKDLKLFSAETVPIRMFTGNQYGNHEVTYTWNRGEQKEFWLFVLRLYFTGHVDVPPPDVIVPSFVHKSRTVACCHLM